MSALTDIENKIFSRKFPWDKIDKKLAKKDKVVLGLLKEACFIEVYFSVYAAKMVVVFWYDVEATSVYTIENFEAYTHYYILKKYLEIAGVTITEDQVRAVRSQDSGKIHNDEIKELVNFMITEHFAVHFFKDLSDLAKEPVLKDILMFLSDQEVSHSQFAFDLLKKKLEKDPKLKKVILEHAKNYQHVGSYVLPHVSRVKDDNFIAIQQFNKKIEDLVGVSLSEYLAQL